MRLAVGVRHVGMVAIVALFLACHALTAVNAQTSERIALVIGNGDYNGDGDYTDKGDLDNAIQDAALIAQTLRKLGFSVVERTDLDFRRMEEEIADFSKKIRGGNKIGFFYYAGHGVQVRNTNYLIPVKANILDVAEFPYKAIDLQRLVSVFDFAENDLNIAVLDACRNNHFRGLVRAETRGLAEFQPRNGTLFAYSTAPNDVAADDSTYARSLARHMATPGIPVETVFRRVTADVKESSGGRQIPWQGGWLAREFYLAGDRSKTPPKAAAGSVASDGIDAAKREESSLELTRSERRLIQGSLNRHGFDVGAQDGLFGDRTRAGIRSFQRREGEAETGYLTDRQAKSLISMSSDDKMTAASGTNGSSSRVVSENKTPLTTFQDCQQCPVMIRIPGGTFIMGSPEDEPGRAPNEGPQRKVTIQGFAIGKYEVTFDEWDACVADGGCGEFTPSDQGWGRGDRPVINVSWNDAQLYVNWLNLRVKGLAYRLPSEAEWEYAARAGTQSPFWWGSSLSTKRANYDGRNPYNNGPKGIYRAGTIPVSNFKENPFGLYQVHGNVWEWVQDDWHSSYTGAPSDGRAWLGSNYNNKVMRGGAWGGYYSEDLRSASREREYPDDRSASVGFRVAKTLSP